jgi:hypothetical protein
MGEACSKSATVVTYVEEVDIKFESYTSSLDTYFKKFENKFNLLKYYQLYEYLLILNNCFHDVTPSQEDYLFLVNEDAFVSFIQKKIRSNYIMLSLLNQAEDNLNIFDTYMKEIFKSLVEAKKELFRFQNPGVKLKKNQITSIEKINLISFGLLYTNAKNRVKVNFLYNLFADETGSLSNSKKLNDFLYFHFLTASLCSLRSIKKLTEYYPNFFDKISDDDYIKYTDAFEVSDVHRLINIFTDKFFEGKTKLTKNEFMEKFIHDENFGWIFSSIGIRHFLEINNDAKKE